MARVAVDGSYLHGPGEEAGTGLIWEQRRRPVLLPQAAQDKGIRFAQNRIRRQRVRTSYLNPVRLPACPEVVLTGGIGKRIERPRVRQNAIAHARSAR